VHPYLAQIVFEMTSSNYYDLWLALVEPLQYPFIQRGLIEVLLMGAVCGAMGAFVVARGWGFIGDAIAHAVFPGVVIAYLGRFNFFIGALAFGALTALGVGAISRSDRLKEDTAIGILFAGMFALGVVLISSARSYTADLGAILFGNVLGVSDFDLVATLLLAAAGGATLATRAATAVPRRAHVRGPPSRTGLRPAVSDE